jgi:hypothetical protein
MVNKKSLVSISIILFFLIVSFSCERQDVRPAFKSLDEVVAWYVKQGNLDWMTPDSTAISRAAFHKGDKVLIIYFTPNPQKGYIFGDIPISLWDEFKNSTSKGRFYNSMIRGKFGYRLNKF